MRASIEDFHRAMAQRDAAAHALRAELVSREQSLAREIGRLSEEIGRRGDEIERLGNDNARRGAENMRLGTENVRLVAEGTRLSAELATVRHQLAQSQAAEAELQARLAATERQAVQLRGFLVDMERSTSWRITAPLRWLASRLRRR